MNKAAILVSMLVASGAAAGPLAAATPSPVAPGGANQRVSLEGCTGQWLFNGVWRIRVNKVDPITLPDVGNPGFAVTVQVRNGTRGTTSMAYAGVGETNLVLADGTQLGVDQTLDRVAYSTAINKDLVPGAGLTQVLNYYLPTKSATDQKPAKWLLEIHQNTMGSRAPHYTTKTPSLRVNLDCQKPVSSQ
ncbi:MAG: hypothetical protein NVSMB5_26510 [Candidatus Velthaea sp.]